MQSLPYRISGYDHQNLPFEVGLDDDLSRLAAMLRFDDPSPIDYIAAMVGRPLEHSPEVDLGEAPIVHPLDQVGT